MNLEYIQAFYMAVKHNSISKAAEMLHFSQPGLSNQIRKLENKLGVSLLSRSNKGVELTEEGKLLFDYAETLLSIQNNIQSDLINLNSSNPTLSIGSCKNIGEYSLPCSIFVYKYIHKQAEINLKITNSSDVIKNLLEHNINIGIVQFNPKIHDVVAKPIAVDDLMLVGNINNSFESISVNELTEMPLILREKQSGTIKVLEKSLNKNGIELDNLNVMYTLNSPESIKASLISGKVFSFLPKLALKKEIRENILKEIKIEGIKMPFNYYLVTRKHYNFTSEEKSFIEFITSSERKFC